MSKWELQDGKCLGIPCTRVKRYLETRRETTVRGNVTWYRTIIWRTFIGPWHHQRAQRYMVNERVYWKWQK